MHPGAVVVAEPLQVLLCVGAQNRALQLSVYCAVAVEKEASVKVPAETREVPRAKLREHGRSPEPPRAPLLRLKHVVGVIRRKQRIIPHTDGGCGAKVLPTLQLNYETTEGSQSDHLQK